MFTINEIIIEPEDTEYGYTFDKIIECINVNQIMPNKGDQIGHDDDLLPKFKVVCRCLETNRKNNNVNVCLFVKELK